MPAPRAVDLEAVGRLIDQLESDLDRARQGAGSTDVLRAEVEQLRILLTSEEPVPADVHAGLAGLRERMHALTDELFTDAIKSGDYLARIGRLLGM